MPMCVTQINIISTAAKLCLSLSQCCYMTAQSYVNEQVKTAHAKCTTCQKRHLYCNRVRSHTWWVWVNRCPWSQPWAADLHIKFSAATGVAAYSIVLIEIYLARVHHFSAWDEEVTRTQLTQNKFKRGVCGDFKRAVLSEIKIETQVLLEEKECTLNHSNVKNKCKHDKSCEVLLSNLHLALLQL